MHACSSDAYMYILDLWSLFGALTPESQFPITLQPTFMHSVKRERMLSEWSLATSTCLFFSSIECTGEICVLFDIYNKFIPAVGASLFEKHLDLPSYYYNIGIAVGICIFVQHLIVIIMIN